MPYPVKIKRFFAPKSKELYEKGIWNKGDLEREQTREAVAFEISKASGKMKRLLKEIGVMILKAKKEETKKKYIPKINKLIGTLKKEQENINHWLEQFDNTMYMDNYFREIEIQDLEPDSTGGGSVKSYDDVD
ncbi:MAG: hypothetical protein IJG00_03605 [Clostridia bacterium]|nr:hypothetical protein [Clostridia bacterium]